jgi:hypothetical protein
MVLISPGFLKKFPRCHFLYATQVLFKYSVKRYYGKRLFMYSKLIFGMTKSVYKMLQNAKVLLFDLDGTLVDSSEAIVNSI